MVPSIYHQCVTGRIGMKPKCITANPAPFHYKENQMAEAQFNEQFTKEERIITAKPHGVKILKKS